MEKWKTIKSNKYCNLITDGTHDTPKKTKDGYKLVTSKNILNGVLNLESAYFISEKDYININNRSKVDQWDILISMIGTVGEVYIEKNKNPKYAIKNVGLLKMNGDKEDALYLYYYLKSPLFQNYLLNNKVGSIQSYITLNNLRNFDIVCFEKQTQNKIVKILSTIDEKIELNNEINEKLEEMAKLLYNEWFVEFNFPNEEGKPYKLSGGEMVESELGMIPKGWEVDALSKLIEFVNGFPFKSGDYKENGKYKILTIKNVSNNELLSTNSDSFINELPINIKDSQVLNIGDYLISLTGEVGRFCVNTINNGLLNQRVAKIILKKDFYSGFIKNLFLSNSFKNIIENKARGSIQLNVSTNNILETKTIIPCESIIEKYNQKINSLNVEVLNNRIENQKLKETRDLLLYKLMNNEIDLSEVEIVYE